MVEEIREILENEGMLKKAYEEIVENYLSYDMQEEMLMEFCRNYDIELEEEE